MLFEDPRHSIAQILFAFVFVCANGRSLFRTLALWTISNFPAIFKNANDDLSRPTDRLMEAAQEEFLQRMKWWRRRIKWVADESREFFFLRPNMRSFDLHLASSFQVAAPLVEIERVYLFSSSQAWASFMTQTRASWVVKTGFTNAPRREVAQWSAYFILDRGSLFRVPKKISEVKLSMLLRLINSGA